MRGSITANHLDTPLRSAAEKRKVVRQKKGMREVLIKQHLRNLIQKELHSAYCGLILGRLTIKEVSDLSTSLRNLGSLSRRVKLPPPSVCIVQGFWTTIQTEILPQPWAGGRHVA